MAVAYPQAVAELSPGERLNRSIEILRHSVGMSQGALGEILAPVHGSRSLSQAAVGRRLGGATAWRTDELELIAAHFDIEVPDLWHPEKVAGIKLRSSSTDSSTASPASTTSPGAPARTWPGRPKVWRERHRSTGMELDRFAEHQRRRNLSPRTVERYGWCLRVWAAHLAPRHPFEAIRGDVERFTRGGSANYRQWRLSVLSVFYRWAIREELTDRDPSLAVERPRVPRRLPRPVHDADLAMALRLAAPRMRVILALAAFAGLRCAGIAGLRVENITVEGLRVVEKGDKERVVPMHPEIEVALAAYGLPESGPVIRGERPRGAPISPKHVSKLGGAYLRSLGIDATLHQLRHWFGTQTYRLGRDLRLTQELMGHASIATTVGYTKVVVDERAVAVVAALSVS